MEQATQAHLASNPEISTHAVVKHLPQHTLTPKFTTQWDF
jgi:hypothetical protein